MISLNSNQWLDDCGSNKENSLIYKQNAVVLWCEPEVNSTIGKARYHHKNYKVILLHYHSKLSLITLTDRSLSSVTWMPKNGKSLTTTHLQRCWEVYQKTVNRMCWCDAVVFKDTHNGTDDDAVFCKDTCQAWIHRKCMSMSKVVYEIWWSIHMSQLCDN